MLLLQMTLTGDCLATIELFVAAEYGYEVAAEIVAERGTVVTGQPDNAIVRSAQARSVTVPTHWLDRFQDAYVAELTQWVRSIQMEQACPGANAWDGTWRWGSQTPVSDRYAATARSQCEHPNARPCTHPTTEQTDQLHSDSISAVLRFSRLRLVHRAHPRGLGNREKTGRENVGMVGGGGLISELDGLDPSRIFAFHLDDLEDTPKCGSTIKAERASTGMRMPVETLSAFCANESGSPGLRLLAELPHQHIRQRRMADLLQLVAHALRGTVDLDHAAQIDRRGDDHQVARRIVDRLGQVGHLLVAVAHRRQQRAGVGVLR